jgi:Ser/Thr protein kinase RdoA (MazF antagonist)
MSAPATLRREIPLPGGTTNAGRVSRIGDTVRRPDRPTGESTRAVLDHLAHEGFDGAPRFLGIDNHGREVLAYIPGRAPIAPTPQWALGDTALVSVAELLRRYHDAVASFDPRGHRWGHALPSRFQDGVISHNDPNLDNVIFRDGRAVALIDFDLAGPGSRAWDLACAARLWIPLREPGDMPAEVRERLSERLALFVEAYGATRAQRRQVVEALPECHRWCYAIVRAAVADGHETFSRQWHSGSAGRAERTGRWLATCAPQLRATLGV